MIMKAMASGCVALFLLSPLSTWATTEKIGENEKFTGFDRKIQTTGGGELSLNYEYFGEPVNAPANLMIYVSCDNNKKERRIEAAKIPMCEIVSYRYEKDVNLLTVEFIYSRVDAGGRVHCDQKDERQYNLRSICRAAAKRAKVR